MRPKLKLCVSVDPVWRGFCGQCFTYSVDRKSHLAFNARFLGVLVAGDGCSTAARCGFGKPPTLHPPTLHSGLYTVASLSFRDLCDTKYIQSELWQRRKVVIVHLNWGRVLNSRIVREEGVEGKIKDMFKLDHENYSAPEAARDFKRASGPVQNLGLIKVQLKATTK